MYLLYVSGLKAGDFVYLINGLPADAGEPVGNPLFFSCFFLY